MFVYPSLWAEHVATTYHLTVASDLALMLFKSTRMRSRPRTAASKTAPSKKAPALEGGGGRLYQMAMGCRLDAHAATNTASLATLRPIGVLQQNDHQKIGSRLRESIRLCPFCDFEINSTPPERCPPLLSMLGC